MRAVFCDRCNHFVAPGDYGNKVAGDVPLHFGASLERRPIAVLAIGRNATLALGVDFPLYFVCPGSTMIGVVEDVPDERDQLRESQNEHRRLAIR